MYEYYFYTLGILLRNHARWIGVGEIHEELTKHGLLTTRRTVQRQLNKLHSMGFVDLRRDSPMGVRVTALTKDLFGVELNEQIREQNHPSVKNSWSYKPSQHSG